MNICVLKINYFIFHINIEKFCLYFKVCLLLYDILLPPSVNCNKSVLNIEGHVYLGKFTPQNQTNEIGNYALMLMHQPYQVPWIQVIGAFLSKRTAPNEVLQKIIIEAVILLERSGFQIHNVITDECL